ncbi:MAG: glycosyltransferase involved in cell wall biosynthesis [Flavobacteriaceae bacterium]|jgi:glycosyltransferase involved in cell wall biosynthesis
MIKKIAVFLPYANPHVIGWIEELKRINDEVLIVCRQPVSRYRKNYFDEFDNLNFVKYFFKSYSRFSFFKEIRKKNILITLGPFYIDFLISLLFLKRDSVVYIMSEPIKREPKYKLFFKKIVTQLIFVIHPKSNIHFLVLGGLKVKYNYSKMGFSLCDFYNFGYFPNLKPLENNKVFENRNIRFLFVGQLIERKGIQFLINSINYLHLNHSNDWSFDIIGDGNLKDNLLNSIDGLSNVTFHGLVTDQNKLNDFYCKANVFFLPSIFDGWGAVVNEALSKSCSLLLSNNVNSKNSLLIENENGFSFDPFDFYSLTLQLNKYFENPSLLKKHSSFSSNLFKEWNSKNAAISFHNKINNIENKNLTLLKKI